MTRLEILEQLASKLKQTLEELEHENSSIEKNPAIKEVDELIGTCKYLDTIQKKYCDYESDRYVFSNEDAYMERELNFHEILGSLENIARKAFRESIKIARNETNKDHTEKINKIKTAAQELRKHFFTKSIIYNKDWENRLVKAVTKKVPSFFRSFSKKSSSSEDLQPFVERKTRSNKKAKSRL